MSSLDEKNDNIYTLSNIIKSIKNDQLLLEMTEAQLKDKNENFYIISPNMFDWILKNIIDEKTLEIITLLLNNKINADREIGFF